MDSLAEGLDEFLFEFAVRGDEVKEGDGLIGHDSSRD
jgi:hypothetical protein